jgi:cysteine desulfurase
MVYLDNSATTRPFDEVVDYMDDINRNTYGNPSSLHNMGIEAEKLVKKARDAVAGSMFVEAREVYFTSGGTESNNLAIRGFLKANPRKGKHIITTKIEHPSVLEVYKYLADQGYEADFLEVDKNGIVDLEMLEKCIRQDTSLISIIYVNNETGAIQPIEQIVKIKNRKNSNAAVHLDAVQAYGKVRLLPKKLGVDMVSVSSHKIHGPKGVGALYVNKSIKIKPVVYGGGQETALRSGTENVPGICGFGLASEIIFKNLEDSLERAGRLKQHFISKLSDNIEDYAVNSGEGALPYIVNVSFPGVRAEVLLHHLEERKIYVSTGSACSSRKNVHSHVLTAMGLCKPEIEGAIRFSFSSLNNENDINETVEALKDIIPKIKVKNRK